MPLENVDQIIVSNLRVSGKEEDAFNNISPTRDNE